MKLSPILIILTCIVLLLGGCQEVPQHTSTSSTETENVIISASKETTAVKKTETSDVSNACEETEPTTQNAKSEQTTGSRETKAVKVTEASERTEQQDKNNNTKADNNEQKKNTEPKEEVTQPKETQVNSKKPNGQTVTKPTQAVTQKPTEPQKPKLDKTTALNNGIAYGQSLGMTYDTSLTISNSSWFPPTTVSDYPTTGELSGVCYEDVDYLLQYWSEQGYVASDFCFNFVISNGDLYLLYS